MSEGTKSATRNSSDVVHVDVELLDRLLNMVGELVIHRASLMELGKRARAKHRFREPVLRLTEATERLTRLSKDIQSSVLKARMVPIERIFTRFHGMLAELARTTERQLRLDVRGESTEVDRKIADDLSEPLVHLVRNAADHGIETPEARLAAGKPAAGTITLDAFHDSNHLVIEVRDDGRGLDLEAIKAKAIARGIISTEEAGAMDARAIGELVFRSGFSTREKVTAWSGRGVGMDAARRRVESIGGTISLETTPGRGTCTRIRVPLTLAIIQALVVRVGREVYALPLENVQETVRTTHDQIETVEDQEVFALRGEALPILRTAEILDVPGGSASSNRFFIVIVKDDTERMGLVVDHVVGRQEIVIKPVPRRLAGLGIIGGASIATDGTVFLIADVLGLFQHVRDAKKKRSA